MNRGAPVSFSTARVNLSLPQGDGDLGLEAGNAWDANTTPDPLEQIDGLIYLNDGAGIFSRGSHPIDFEPLALHTAGDMNGDGTIDLVVIHENAIAVLLNGKVGSAGTKRWAFYE